MVYREQKNAYAGMEHAPASFLDLIRYTDHLLIIYNSSM
jgi:hypothetical protein